MIAFPHWSSFPGPCPECREEKLQSRLEEDGPGLVWWIECQWCGEEYKHRQCKNEAPTWEHLP